MLQVTVKVWGIMLVSSEKEKERLQWEGFAEKEKDSTSSPKCFHTRSTCATTRDGTGSHFVTQRTSDPGIQRPGDPVDPVTLFYNELQTSTNV